MGYDIIRQENGERVVSLRWVIGFLITAIFSLLSVLNAYQIAANEKTEDQQALINSLVQTRLNTLEWNQSKVLTTLDANKEMLNKIYDELKIHRQTGK